jgi:hypothetical protein
MSVSALPPLLSSDGHLEVRPATGNMVDFFGLGDTPVGRTVRAAAR